MMEDGHSCPSFRGNSHGPGSGVRLFEIGGSESNWVDTPIPANFE